MARRAITFPEYGYVNDSKVPSPYINKRDDRWWCLACECSLDNANHLTKPSHKTKAWYWCFGCKDVGYEQRARAPLFDWERREITPKFWSNSPTEDQQQGAGSAGTQFQRAAAAAVTAPPGLMTERSPTPPGRPADIPDATWATQHLMDIADVKQEITEVKQEIAGVKDQIVTTAMALTTVIVSVKKDIAEVNDTATEMTEHRGHRTHADIADVKKEIKDVKQEITYVKNDIVEVKHGIADMKIADVKQGITDVTKEIAAVKYEIAETKTIAINAGDHGEDRDLRLKGEITNVKEEITEVKFQLQDHSETLALLVTKLDNLTTMVSSLCPRGPAGSGGVRKMQGSASASALLPASKPYDQHSA